MSRPRNSPPLACEVPPARAGRFRGPGFDITMGRRLYVGNLPYSTTEDQLRELFSAHGRVTDVHVAMDRETGRPRGFAFVTLGSDEEAQAAVRALHDRDFGGRPLVVNEARERGAPPPARPPRARPPHDGGAPRAPRPPRMPVVPLEPPPEEEGPRRRPRGHARKPGPERGEGGRGRHHLGDDDFEDVSNWRELLDEDNDDELEDILPFSSRKKSSDEEEEDWRSYVDRDEDDRGTLAERLRRDESQDS